MTREELFNLTIDSVSMEQYSEIKERIDSMPKPVDGLGKFENLICKIGCAQHSSNPDISKKSLVIMCADNGIIEEGVTEMGGYMTGVTARNMAEGVASISYMAEIAGIEVLPVDIGINGDMDCPNLLNKKICKGTKNFLKDPAMTEEQALCAIKTGIEIAKGLHDKGVGIICTGDMGIGNTTTAVALICAVLDGDPFTLTGRNTELSDAGYKKKVDVIFDAMKQYGYDADIVSYDAASDRYAYDADKILDRLINVGGLDIAGLVGIFIGGAMYHMPVVVDGIMSAAAALTADSLIPGVKQYLIGSHFGKEPATEIVFTELELDPVINADMAVGEGTGAVMLMPMLDMVMKAFTELAEDVVKVSGEY